MVNLSIVMLVSYSGFTQLENGESFHSYVSYSGFTQLEKMVNLSSSFFVNVYHFGGIGG